MCEFCFLYCDVWLNVVRGVYSILAFVSDGVYVDLKYDVFFLLLIVGGCCLVG